MANELWILFACVLVFFLVAGLGCLTAGILRFKNAVSALTAVFLAACLSGLLWLVCGYSLTFSGDHFGLIGDLSTTFLDGLSHERIPEAFFQMLFCMTASTILVAPFAERTNFRIYFFFIPLWNLFVYYPVAHWVWHPAGVFSNLGVLDYAGGIVVHLSTGFSALAISLRLGRRRDYFNLRPHSDSGLIYLGLFFVLIGWLGFNGGSSGSLNFAAKQSMLVTIVAGLTGALVFVLLELRHPPYRLTMTGLSLGVVGALVVVSSSAAYLPLGKAMTLAALNTLLVFYAIRTMNRMFKVDDPLEVFSTHGISGFLGGTLALAFLGNGLLDGFEPRLTVNFLTVSAVSLYSFFITWILLRLLAKWLPLALTEKQEEVGTDLCFHGEKYLNP